LVRYDFNILAVYLSFRTPIGGSFPLPPSGGATAFTPIRIEDFPKSNDSRSLVILFGLARSRCYTGPDFAPVSATSVSPYSACHARVTCRNRPAMWRACVRACDQRGVSIEGGVAWPGLHLYNDNNDGAAASRNASQNHQCSRDSWRSARYSSSLFTALANYY